MTGKMAAAELKQNDDLCVKNDKNIDLPITLNRENECYRFKTLDLVYYVLSIGLFLAVFVTDSIAFVQYLSQGYLIWGCFTISLTILPNCIIQLFSLRWHCADSSLETIHWVSHFLILGVLHRYVVLIYNAVRSLKSEQFVKNVNWVHRQESDVCMLHLFVSFMGAAPQLVLQIYITIMLHHLPLWTCTSAIASFCSLSWAVGTYTKAKQKINVEDSNPPWIPLIFQALWRAGMLISRIAGLVLIATCIRKWFLLYFGLNWLCTTIWVISQNTDFCPTLWEERIYNCIIGLIYCFDFFNLRVGKSRYRVFIYYFTIVIQTLAFVIIYISYFKDSSKTDTLIIAVITTIGSMLIGLISMLFYYQKFHPSKANNARKQMNPCTEIIVTNKIDSPRSLNKYNQPANTCQTVKQDKQLLLSDIVQNTDSLEEGNVNQACTENEMRNDCAVSDSETSHSLDIQNNYFDSDNMELTDRQKRRGICLPLIDDLNIDKVATTKDLNSCFASYSFDAINQKAIINFQNREFCLTDIDSIFKKHMNEVSFSLPSNELFSSSDGFSKIAERKKLDTPTMLDNDDASKIEKLSKDETMSYVTSIHDYENVCPLGVARPPWCIRSWKGYTDIETYIHDDSVVRDRRRDTLTSTTTGTTYSSDFSDTTSSFLKGLLKQNDYLDTLIYDIVDSREVRSIDGENDGFIFSTIDQSSILQNSALHIAKPIVIDDRGAMLALDTIIEERSDDAASSIGVKSESISASCNSVSTLVSTIDQIRKCTAENSPMHVYHKTESQCEDFETSKTNIAIKNIKKTKPFVKVFHSNEIDDFKDTFGCNLDGVKPINVTDRNEVDTMRKLVRNCTIESVKQTPLIDAILSDSPILRNRGKIQKHLIPDENLESNEDNVYVEMFPLVPMKSYEQSSSWPFEAESSNRYPNPTLDKIDPTNRSVCNLSKITPKLNARQNMYPFNMINSRISYEKCKKNGIKRKLSLLKEKFDPTSRLMYAVTPNNSVTKRKPISTNGDHSNESEPTKKSDLSLTCDKENLAPAVPSNFEASDIACDKDYMNIPKAEDIYDIPLCDVQLETKDKKKVCL